MDGHGQRLGDHERDDSIHAFLRFALDPDGHPDPVGLAAAWLAQRTGDGLAPLPGEEALASGDVDALARRLQEDACRHAVAWRTLTLAEGRQDPARRAARADLALLASLDGCAHRLTASALASRNPLGALRLRARALSLGVEGALGDSGTQRPGSAGVTSADVLGHRLPPPPHALPCEGRSESALALAALVLAAGLAAPELEPEAAGIDLALLLHAPWRAVEPRLGSGDLRPAADVEAESARQATREALALEIARQVVVADPTGGAWERLLAGSRAAVAHLAALRTELLGATAHDVAHRVAHAPEHGQRHGDVARLRGVAARPPSIGARDLYAGLLGVERRYDRATLRAAARQRLQDTIASAEAHMWDGLAPPRVHSPEALTAWVRARHAAHAAEHADPTLVIPREALVRACIALAPALAIDGAWAQCAARTARADDEVAARLFRVLFDECGGGDPGAHHGALYLALVRSMRPDLPEFPSAAFVRWPGFADEDFEAGALWLALAEFGAEFRAEALGLNLTIELAGVGGAYRTTTRSLAAHGFDPTFFALHELADDIEHGHTAWSIAAIERELELCWASHEGTPRERDRALQARWQRVRTGLALRSSAAVIGPKSAGRLRAAWTQVLAGWRSLTAS